MTVTDAATRIGATRRTIIDPEPAAVLASVQDLALLRSAFARAGSPAIRARLAQRLLLHDHFAEVIDLLEERGDLTFGEAMVLGEAWIAREFAGGYERVRDAAARAFALADHDDQRAAALALRGKAETKLGDIPAARATLAEALLLDPFNKDACKRLAALGLAADDAAGVLTLTGDLMTQGAGHSRLFAARAVALARLGDPAAARELIGADRLHHARRLDPPPGWADIAAFNRDLAEELLGHPGLRYERYGSASELSWRIDEPLTGRAPLVRLLLDRIIAAMHDHIERIVDIDHPWVRARPDEAVLRSWCVITDDDGYETWHVHQFGWLSGAYYVQVPEAVATGSGEGGCIAFGLPEDLAGGAVYPTDVVRPQDGTLLMFPSHTYHRTFAHGLTARRICLAFDLRPVD